MTRDECAWAAGVIDGEGTLVETGSGSTRIAVNMCHKPTVVALYKLFGGQFRAHTLPEEGHRQQWHWEVLGSDVLRVLTQIRPFMLTKSAEATVLAKIACSMKERGPGGGPMPPSVRKKRLRWSEQLKLLKKKEWKCTQ